MARLGTLLGVMLLVGIAVGCGCAASPERRDDATTVAQNEQELWGATLVLPDGWTGGENDAGGYEFTDGEVALMVGRHALATERSLDDFMSDRARALEELGAKPEGKAAPAKVRGKDVMTLAASAEAGVEVRLLVTGLGPADGLSLMMVGDASDKPKLNQAWERVTQSLTLP